MRRVVTGLQSNPVTAHEIINIITIGQIDEAIGLYERYLVITRKTSYSTNAKLICCKEDRAGMNRIFHDLLGNSEFKRIVQDNNNEYKPMPNTGNPSGRSWKNYRLLTKYFANKYQENEKTAEGRGKEVLLELYNKLVSSMRVVQIVVKDPTDGPKIFDSLNSKQEPMTIGDLVRNELFSKIAHRDDDEIERLDRDNWHPFYEKFNQNNNSNFDKVFEQYFFPYVLTLNPNVKKADAFNFLRDRWAETTDPSKIINQLSMYQDIFIDLYYGTNLTECDTTVKACINRLSRMDTPTSVYPFLMHVVRAALNGEISSANAGEIMARVESFLVRRVVCGYEPTGLHAAFKALWDDCAGNYSVDNVVANIRRHSTVKWPGDEEFEKNIKERPLYKVKITPYILSEWNGYLGGDIPILDSQQIEHVLPDNPDPESVWMETWTKKQQEECKHCLPNLLPISGKLNQSIQNADYSEKRLRYSEDSALKAPRLFAKKYEGWTPVEYESRAEELAEWALNRWKY